jgi:hypothetical protein
MLIPVPASEWHPRPPPRLYVGHANKCLETLRHLAPLQPFRVDAARPRLGRAFRTAPASRQTINQQRFGTHRAFTHALPPSFGLRSVPFTVPGLFLPAAAQVKEETSRKRQKGKKHEIRRSQHTHQRGRGLPSVSRPKKRSCSKLHCLRRKRRRQ